ncbi:MAG: polyprenyl synthetase family protein [Pseudomonadota bacterium]
MALVAEQVDQRRSASAETFGAAVAALKEIAASDLLAVNQTILARLQSDVSMIPEVAGHLIQSGGKRLRPLSTLVAARMFGCDGLDHVRLAAAVELIHAATLLHDDVVDGSELRRGAATANVIWGNSESVLVGDFLFSRSFELMVETGRLPVLQILSHASSVIAEGEVLQLSTQNDIESTFEQYLKVVGAKTAALFAAATEVAAVVADQSAAMQASLREFGLRFGIAYQLVDDALDYSGAQAAIGKSVGDDFREGKMTAPVVLAYERARPGEKAFWRRTIGESDVRDGELEKAIGLMARDGVIAETLARARAHADAAVAALAEAPDNAYRRALIDLADTSVARAY